VATILVGGFGVTTVVGTGPTADDQAATEETGETINQQAVIIELRELDGSGFSGEAVLASNGEQTEVAIELGGPTGDNPVHIHGGTCDELDPNPLFPLLGDRFAINVHKSATEIGIYVACGEITA